MLDVHSRTRVLYCTRNSQLQKLPGGVYKTSSIDLLDHRSKQNLTSGLNQIRNAKSCIK
jgi:hypothetical protein